MRSQSVPKSKNCCAPRATARIDAEGEVAAFAEVVVPEFADDGFPEIDLRAGLVILGPPADLSHGVSRNPGNLILNWRELAEVVPDVAIAAAATLSGPQWLGFRVALYIWNRVWRGAEEALSENEASVMCGCGSTGARAIDALLRIECVAIEGGMIEL